MTKQGDIVTPDGVDEAAHEEEAEHRGTEVNGEDDMEDDDQYLEDVTLQYNGDAREDGKQPQEECNKFGNQGGNRNFFGNGQRSNQSSQFQKPFNNNKSYSNSYYQNPPPQTQESKIEEITVDFNGKIDYAYNNLNTKIKTLVTQVRKLETQVIQTGETIKKQEAFAREAGAIKGKHHVNAIIDDDFWQVVRHEKLEEGDFEIESSMSLGGSRWCRPMSMNSH
ncbi:hypothetical protein DY000_02021930 [Brassica cretica]|uniref:t-SNARE coiled-coil homology domain-containing protein n=1 Tax=Brassica cretica TaxID=69181 RepID=A0ABQ7EAX3_BRACR|nr:hypothetical protein DY000_02021930 [Brassica cretica]